MNMMSDKEKLVLKVLGDFFTTRNIDKLILDVQSWDAEMGQYAVVMFGGFWKAELKARTKKKATWWE